MSSSVSLGELITSSQASLIARWTDLVRERLRPPASEATLVDSLPSFLDSLGQALKALPAGERPRSLPLQVPALAHGHPHLPEGFRLEAVTWEYGVLRECILELAEQAGLALTLPEVRTLSRCMDEAITQAAAHYVHQRETTAETALARFRQLFESNIIGLIFFDLEGGITDANDAFLACVGYTREDLQAGRVDWRKLTPPEWHQQDEALVAELLTTGKHEAVEKAYVRKDGSHVPIVLASTFFHHSQREGIGFVLDISARKQAEQALRESEARARAAAAAAQSERALLDAILEAAPVGIVVADAHGQILRTNAANLRLWGLPPPSERESAYGEWVGWWADGSERHGQRLLGHEWALIRALRGEVVPGDVVAIQPFDDPAARRIMVNSGAPVRTATGELLGGVIAQMDITARLEAETALRESEARFRALADNIPQLAWMANPQGDIFWYNRRWYEYTGTTLEQMRGWGWKSVHDPAHVQRVEARFREAIASGQEWEDTFPLRGKDGQYRWFLSRALPVRDEHGQVTRWFGTNTDIEEQRRQQAELRTAVQVRDTFLTVAAHELKTPLTSLALRLAQLQRGAQGELAGQKPRLTELRRLEAAGSQMQRLMALVEGLLDVSRITHRHLQLTLEDLDVGDVVREVTAALELQAGRAGSRLEVKVESLAPGRFDRMRLEQVVTNLLSNAIKFGAGKPIHVALWVEGTRALLRIRDEGIGIAPETLSRLFEKFERGVSEQNYGGLGLGLYVTKTIVEAMGGTVTVESVLGEGATFTVELPLQQ